MEREDAIIGLFYDIDDFEFVTANDLLRHIADGDTTYTMSDYTDWRKSTNITRFRYDPFTGKKIDWRKLRKQYKI